MNKTWRALSALCLILILGLGGISESLATNTDYTLAEKLQKQLEAGSGFGGTLSVSLDAVPGREREALTTVSPLVFDISYLFVRPTAGSLALAEHRFDITYPSGDAPTASLSFSLQDENAYLKSSFLGEGWYSLGDILALEGASGPASSTVPSAGLTLDEAPGDPPQEPSSQPGGATVLGQAIQGLMQETPMPSLLSFFGAMLLSSGNKTDEELTKALGTYTTKIDLWIEGYRQSAVLGKLEDGTTTMEVKYAISPAAIKAQLKQMVLDLLSDDTLLAKLQASLPLEEAQMMLNPQMQSYYFFAIDELPLEGDMTISRTVSLKGDTLGLHLRLPLYDATSGAIELAYDRTAGMGDLPDENVLSLMGRDMSLRLEYQEYSTMTDVVVYQGTLLQLPRGLSSYEVDEGAKDAKAPPKGLSAAFTLTHSQAADNAEDGASTLTHELKLSLEPYWAKKDGEQENPMTEAEKEAYVAFPSLEIDLNAIFSSRVSSTAPTTIDATLTVSGEELPQTLQVILSGRSKAKWVPEAISTANAAALTAEKGLTSALVQAGLQASLMFLPQLHLPEAVIPEEPAAAPGESPEAP